MKRQLLILGLLTLSVFAHAQVVLNEFSFANYNGVAGFENEDWVEFYNPTSAPVNIGGFYISDNINNPTKWEIPAGTTVPANGFRCVLISGTGDYDPGFLGQLNTSFKVTQTAGEEIVFTNPIGNVLETYDFEIISPNQANHSWGRSSNGAADWKIFPTPTPNDDNTGPSANTYAANADFSLQAGYYPGTVSVTITTAEPNSVIRYTLDGSEVTAASPLYSGPLSISTTTVVRARVYSNSADVLPGFIETNTYFIGGDQHTIKVTSVSGTELGDGSWWGDELMHVEFFDENGQFLAEATGDSNEHGNDSNAYDQRGFDYVTRDAMGYDNQVQYPIINTRDRPSYERLIFKAAANDNYPFANGAHIRDAYCHQLSILGGLHLDERSTESSIVYINGQYWGVYEIREKVDDIDFTEYYKNQPEGFVDFIKTWGGTWVEYGSDADWTDLVNFATTNDLSVQANYDYVLTQYNTMSLIDYFVLNGYVLATDWLNWNTAWWRGRHPEGDAKRWRYALWDNDNTFGHGTNYTGVPSTNPNADPCQIDEMGDVGGQGHVPILNALFDNEDFLADYVQRYATLSNTIFSCDRMIEVLDSMVNVIAPEMQRQVDRWGGTYSGWEANVQEVRNFILQRCNTTVIGGLEDCYDVTAYTLTIQIIGDGEILVQEIEISDADSPFTGTYFGGLPIDLVAQVADCGSFGGWEIVSGDATLSSVSDPITELIINGDATISVTFNTGTGLSEMNLVVEPEGAGTITLDGTEISTFPYSEEFEYNLEKTLSATANEWFEFEEWQSTDYDMTPNATASEITVNTCSAGTITAVFTELPHASLRVEVSPAGSGSVEMEGALLTGLPWTDVIAANVSYDFEAIPITDISVFDHWEINNNVITPNDLSALISLNLIEDDTLVAHFRILQREELQVRVQPEGAGTISMDGNNLELPFSENLLIDETYTFTTAPIDEWSTFIGWQLNNHTLSPNATSLAVSLDFVMPDELVALYNVIPHQPVTVLVEPPFAGTITFNDGVITMDNRTEVMAAQENIGFSAVPEEYFDFSHWEIKKGAILGPVKEAATTMIFNEEPDTVIAHFTRQDLQWFVPNSFTPNGDGTNDVFKIYTNAQDPEYFEMRVFNRWGEVMFETNDADKAWEGDFIGGEYYLPDGLYTYYIKLKWIHAEQFEEVRGTILMYR